MRECFFFGLLAKSLRSDKCLVYPVQVAKNPILKLQFHDLWVDLSFSIVANSYINLSDEIVSELQPIDEFSQNAIVAVRICATLKQMMDDRPEFVKLLSDVKRWAFSRGVYGQNLCYLGGISWAILCAYVVQKFSEAPTPPTQVYWMHCFFKVFSKWTWPNPIFLEQSLHSPGWNPLVSV
jgi:poly(A) polymerase